MAGGRPSEFNPKIESRTRASDVDVWCSHDELVDITELIQNPRNPNTHPDKQIALLAKIIKNQGWRQPITVSKRSGFIVKGHGRLAASKVLMVEKVPVDYQDYATEAEEYADLIADNRIAELAEIDDDMISDLLGDTLFDDFDMDLTGFDAEELGGMLEDESTEGLTDEDEVPEVPEEPTTVLGQVFKLGDHRLMCGDSTSRDDVEKLMDGQKADMVFTDPPYGISIVGKSGKVDGDSPFGSKTTGTVGGGKLAKCRQYAPIEGDDTIDTALKAIEIIKELESDVQVIWGGNYYANTLENSSCWIVWDKQNSGNFADCELAWTNQTTAVRQFTHMWNGMIKASEHGEGRVHPTQKPIALAEWCYDTYGQDCETVLDLFGGSGSALIGCETRGKSCYMMEFAPAYCDVIIKRWEDFTGKKAELIDG